MDIRYFLGANTAGGFHSHYDQLLPGPDRRMIRILKGGSGCGKSTLMKKVAAHGEQLGLTVHRIPCSSDPDSLDGVVIPAAGYAVVDGTAPHVVEPQLCGCGESYIDLGAGYDVSALLGCRHILQGLREAGQRCYPRAAASLNALAALEQTTISGLPISRTVLEKEFAMQGGGGSVRTVFLSGHSPKGRLTCWETVSALCPRVYALRGSMRDITDFLKESVTLAVSRGWNCFVGDSPLLPGTYLEHLLVPDLGLAFVSDTALAPYPGKAFRILGSHPAQTETLAMQQTLLKDATAHLRQAKEYHDLLEASYAPFVDFTVANRAALDCCAELETLYEA